LPGSARGGGDISGIPATQHGAERLEQQGWTEAQYADVVNNASFTCAQRIDLSTVFVRSAGRNSYHVYIQGDHGVITSFKSLTRQALDRLAGNRGWYPYP